MSPKSKQSRLKIEWSEEARSDIRAIDRQTALGLLHCIDRYLLTRKGDVKKLTPPLISLRLRCGDYRIFFKQIADEAIKIVAVSHRRDAYR